jgi:hypothetical protein
LYDVLHGLGKPVYQADDAAGGIQCLGEKDRQDRVEHLRRDVGKQTAAGEQQRVP